jgi:7-cyano-7-deazaguanine synthase
MAQADGYICHALSVAYGQRHSAELHAAARLAVAMGAASHRVIHVELDRIGGSALTDRSIAVPEPTDEAPSVGIPVTYVPARNTLFLSLALGLAEVQGARHLFIGVNAVDYSGYPDCRPEFIRAFEALARLATKVGVEAATDDGFHIHTPLISMSKAEIIRSGTALGVDYGMTVSCYQADMQGRACGKCDSCRIRRSGFAEAGTADPTRYA